MKKSSFLTIGILSISTVIIVIVLILSSSSKNYKVAFDTNGASTIINRQIVSPGNTAIKPIDPQKDNYLFQGWFTDNNTFKNKYNFSTAVNSNITLYANWANKAVGTFTVNFDTSDGTGILAQVVDAGGVVSKPDTDPTITYGNFGGWYKDASCTVVFDFNTTIYNDITIYAKWNRFSYTVKFDMNSNDAYGTMDDAILSCGISQPLPVCNYSRDGYNIMGWFTNADGTGSEYADGESVLNLRTIDGDSITLYAQWSIATLGLKYSSINNDTAYEVSIGDDNTLSNITLLKGYNGKPVTSIAAMGFQSCTSLQTITIPNSINNIGHDAFSNCTNLQEIIYEKNSTLTNIESNAYSGCSSLTQISIPNSVQSLNSRCFYKCTSLTDVTLSDKMNNIDNECFSGCSSLVNMNVCDSIVRIGTNAFADCTSLQDFKLSDTNSSYVVRSGVLYSKDETTLVNYPSGLTRASFTVPSTVNSINTSAFAGNPYIQKVIFDANSQIQTIRAYTFNNCTSLNNITVPNSISQINSYAFAGCISINNITLPNNVTIINDYVFADCSSLQSVIIDSSLNYIGQGVFKNCTSLVSADFTDSNLLASIPSYALYNCPLLQSFHIPASVTSIGDFAFSHCDVLTSIDIVDNITSIGNYGFSSCNALASVNISDSSSLNYIGVFAFSSDKNISAINIPDSLITIDKNAFNGCTSLATVVTKPTSNLKVIGDNSFNSIAATSIDIPDSVEIIDDSAFINNHTLTSVNINSTSKLQKIGMSAFSNANMTTIIIPDGVTYIGDECFSGCASLTTVNVSDTSNLQYIGQYQFYNDTNLTAFNIPDSVTSIGQYSFSGCSNLTTVNINSTSNLSIMDNCIFNNCSKLQSIIIPDALTYIGGNVFASCSALKSVTIGANSSLTFIDSNAFSNCSALKVINIPDSVTKIGNSCFNGAGLTNITLGSGLKSIGALTFMGNSSTNMYVISNTLISAPWTNKGTIKNWCSPAINIAWNCNRINYNLNGGLNDVNNPNGYSLDMITDITLVDPTQVGYIFGGWYSDAGFTTGNEVTVVKSGTTGAVDLYAKWTPIVYSITFDSNGSDGGTAVSGISNINYGDTVTIPANTWTLTGKTFNGWNTLATGSGTAYNVGDVVANLSSVNGTAVTLYAQWI